MLDEIYYKRKHTSYKVRNICYRNIYSKISLWTKIKVQISQVTTLRGVRFF